MSIEFNASISVTELLMKTLENCAKDLAQRCIREASLRHGFDADEEIRILGLENLSIIRKQMVKKTVEKPEKQDKKKKEKVSDVKKTIKPSFPVPFIKELVNSEGCQGLAYNRGLFTQCPKNRMENGLFCKGCQLEADNNASGCPECGTVESRLAADLYAFKDPQGRSPVSYVKVLNKLKLSTEFVVEEAGKLNIIIPNEHFVDEQVKKSSSSRGRPKKVGVVEVDCVTDLFAKLTCETEYDDVLDELLDNNDNKSEKSNISDITDDNSDKSEDKKSKKSEKSSNKLTEEEKEIKKAQLEQERANRKAEREQKLIAEKEEKEAKRIAEKEKKDAEKEAEKEAKRLAEIAEKEKKNAEKEAKRLADIAEKEKKIAEKEAEKEAKRLEKEKKDAEKEAEKEAKRLEKEKKESEKSKKVSCSKKTIEQETKKEEKKIEEVEPAKQEKSKTEPTKVGVKRFQYNGKIYLKSSVNILYDPDTKEEIGIWNPETKTIEELPEEDEEEEEDEYESDDE